MDSTFISACPGSGTAGASDRTPMRLECRRYGPMQMSIPIIPNATPAMKRRSTPSWISAGKQIPEPSLIVDSGGGLHVYWLSDRILSVDEWQPFADALMNA